MDILVFKTNLRYKKQIHAVTSHLNNLDGVLRWNVDLHDKDRILRIEARNLSPRSVEQMLSYVGYFCEELRD